MSERINNEVFCFCFCSVRVHVCARVGLVQAATSANTPWKTNSVGVDGASRQRSSSDLPAVHPPLRVTSTSTFFLDIFLIPFFLSCQWALRVWTTGATVGSQLGETAVGCPQTHTRCCPWPQPRQPLPQIPIHSLATPEMAHSLLRLAIHFNSIHTFSSSGYVVVYLGAVISVMPVCGWQFPTPGDRQ